jgi:hypothetical protein
LNEELPHQPSFLCFTQQHPGRVQCSARKWLQAVTVGLIRAIRPGIEHFNASQSAEVNGAIESEIGPAGQTGSPHRHVFVPCLPRIGATKQEFGGIDTLLLRNRSSEVVVKFMIIPNNNPWAVGMNCLQVLIRVLLIFVSPAGRKYDISVTNFYNWQKILFEGAAQLFDRKPNAANVRRQEAAVEKKVEALEAKLV